MTKEEHDKIIDFVNSDDYILLNNYISKPYEETITEQDKEIERLNNILKEIKEEIKEIFKDENWYSNYSYNDLEIKLKDVLEILDKENK